MATTQTQQIHEKCQRHVREIEELMRLNDNLDALYRTLDAIRVELIKLNTQIEEIPRVVDKAITKYKRFWFKMWFLFLALIGIYVIVKLLIV